MKSKLLIVAFIAILLYSAGVAPLISYCQEEEERAPPRIVTPKPEPTPTPTPAPTPAPTPERTPWWSMPTSPDDGGGQNEGLNIPLDIGGAAFGVAVFVGVAIAAFVVVKKRKVSEKDLRKLPPTEFQNWVIKKLAGKSSSLRDSHVGIDGYTIEGQPISIKQSDGIGRNVIENFAAAMGRIKAKNGIIVAFSFGSDAYTGIVRAKLNYRIEIKMVTVKELIEGRGTISL
jgi:hypothetical protein